MRSQLLIVALCLIASSGPAFANHPEDSCPDTHVDQGQSLDGLVVHETTWEAYPDGAQLPINTPLRASARGTARGYCDKYVWSGSSCIYGNTQLKTFIAFNTWQRTQNAQKNEEKALSTAFIPGANRQEFDGVAEHIGSYVVNENQGGIFSFRQRGVINNTTCDVGADEIWDTFTVYLMPENRCPDGDANSSAGNPCNAGTGNKHETETDYASAGTGLNFTRSYNSQIPICAANHLMHG
jgi:hypothetical protein